MGRFDEQCKEMEVEEIPFNVSLPLLGFGTFTLLLSFCFCCYLWRLKRNAEKAERGFVISKYKTKNKNEENDSCPVCLEEFHPREKIAVCQCRHSFHSKCLIQWLSQRNICPLCKSPVSAAGERTGLIPAPPQPTIPIVAAGASALP